MADSASIDDSAVQLGNLFVSLEIIRTTFCGTPAIVLFMRNMTDSVRKNLLKIYKAELK